VSTFIDGKLDRNRALYLLTMQDAAQRGMTDHWPKARWCKFLGDGDSVLVMTWMNKACAEQFYTKCSPLKVIGHCDRVCFSDMAAASYAKTDREAIERAGEIIEVFEPVEGGDPVRVLKLAFRVDSPGLSGWFVYGECP
jgi:hypothetical protein